MFEIRCSCGKLKAVDSSLGALAGLLKHTIHLFVRHWREGCRVRCSSALVPFVEAAAREMARRA